MSYCLVFLQRQHAKADGPDLLPVSGHADERPWKPAGHGGCLQGQTTQVGNTLLCDWLMLRVSDRQRSRV